MYRICILMLQMLLSCHKEVVHATKGYFPTAFAMVADVS